jgi:hypothetical protein
MDSMILPQVHLTPAEGLDLGHAEQSLHPVLLSTPLSSQGPNPSSQRLLLSRGRLYLKPTAVVPLGPTAI